MNTQIKGKVFVFGNNVDTDQIYPGRFVEFTNVEDVAKYAMYGADPTFVKEVKQGDIIIAGKNFGCGSSRTCGYHSQSSGCRCDYRRVVCAYLLPQRHQSGAPTHCLPALCRKSYPRGDALL